MNGTMAGNMAKFESSGNMIKLKSELTENEDVKYYLNLDQKNRITLNEYVNSRLEITFSGIINCVATGEKISKSYNQGYSYKSFITLPECDLCQVRPELCHLSKGTCRDPEWGKENCLIPHIVYLAETSDLKIGITRKKNLPYRWIDQGALQAVPLFEVPSRLAAGLIEVELKKHFEDITNWRKMLKKKEATENLELSKIKIQSLLKDYLQVNDQEIQVVKDSVTKLHYPISEEYFSLEKVRSLSLDKEPKIQGRFLGIKGQYLLFDIGVLNLRKYQGYFLHWKFL